MEIPRPKVIIQRKYTTEPIYNILFTIDELKENFNNLLGKDEIAYISSVKEKILESQKQISFNEKEHKYFVNGKECISVSHVVDKFSPNASTNFDLVAQNYAIKNGGTGELWRKRWKLKSSLATNTGNFVHNFCEDLTNIINGKKVEFKYGAFENGYYLPLTPKSIAGYKYFYDCLNIGEFPILAEIQLLWKDYNICGTFDQLIYSVKEKGIILRDYKTNETLTKDFQKVMFYPFGNLNDESLGHYIIQQNLYSFFLNLLKIKVLRRELVWLKDNETYELIELPNIENLIPIAIDSVKNLIKK